MKSWTLITTVLLLSGPSAAHESSAERPQWCDGGRLAIVGSFAFTAAEIGEYADCRTQGHCAEMEDLANMRAGGPSNDNCADCGDELDDWTTTQRLAQNQCNLYARLPREPSIADLGEVAVRVERPDSFHNANHHGDDWTRQEVAGYCLRCEETLPPVDVLPD